jgi:hypothetical protein
LTKTLLWIKNIKHNVINEGVAHKGARNWNEQWSS